MSFTQSGNAIFILLFAFIGGLESACSLFFIDDIKTTNSNLNLQASMLFVSHIQISSIHIYYRWVNGLGGTLYEAYYTLQHKNNQQIRGTASFSDCIHHADYKCEKTIEDIIIPLNVVQDFLQVLTSSPLEKGKYENLERVTDVGMLVKIEIKTKTKNLAWFKNTLFRVTLKCHRQKDALLQPEAKIKTQYWREV